jgi:hypothetical protein
VLLEVVVVTGVATTQVLVAPLELDQFPEQRPVDLLFQAKPECQASISKVIVLVPAGELFSVLVTQLLVQV